jgi:uncharacterized membrane protein YjjP (DUF1212 family)
LAVDAARHAVDAQPALPSYIVQVVASAAGTTGRVAQAVQTARKRYLAKEARSIGEIVTILAGSAVGGGTAEGASNHIQTTHAGRSVVVVLALTTQAERRVTAGQAAHHHILTVQT